MVYSALLQRILIIGMLLLLAVPLLVAAAESKSIPSSSPQYRSLEFQTFRGELRLGGKDTSGLSIAGRSHQDGQKVRENPELFKAVAQRINTHNTSIGLLARLDYLREFKGCFEGMDAYEPRTEVCGDRVVEHGAQTSYWLAFIESMAHSMTQGTVDQAFCFGRKGCATRAFDRVRRIDENGRSFPLDEFEKRDFIANLMGKYHQDFVNYYRDKRWPSEAYVVHSVQLSEYDFTTKGFTFRLPLRLPLQSVNYRVTPQPGYATVPFLRVEGKFEPETAAEKAAFKKHQHTGLQLPLDVPMAASQAREIVQQGNPNRFYYAVVKVGFSEREAPVYQALANAATIKYHFSANRVELFADEALTQKVAEIPIFADLQTADDPDAGTNRYSMKSGSDLLDGRAYNLLRFAQGNLPQDQLERVAENIAGNEKRLWAEHRTRVERAEAPIETGQNANHQKRLLDQKKAAQDQARLQSVSWEELNQLTAEQQQAYYQYIMAYLPVTERTPPVWPSVLPAVPWGMNLATIFRKGYLSDKPHDMTLPPLNELTGKLQRFTEDLAATNGVDHLTLVMELDQLTFDDKAEKLKLNRHAFTPARNLTFADKSNNQHSQKGIPLVSAGAKNRMVYSFTESDAGIDYKDGRYMPYPPFGHCTTHSKRRSKDCATSYQLFTDFYWHTRYLALDRDVAISEVDMSMETANRLMSMRPDPSGYLNSRRGWRLVVELAKPQLEVIRYESKTHSSSTVKSAEAHTLFADVERVLLLSPTGEIAWSKAGSEFPAAAKKTQITAGEEPASYQFPAVLSLKDPLNRPEAALYDFLLAKYYPQQLDERMLEAMISSRWGYESQVKEPIGGRFFNQGTRQPDYGEVQALKKEFRHWLMARTRVMPSDLMFEMPLVYANSAVQVHNACTKFIQPADAPVRNVHMAQQQAQQVVNRCENDYRIALEGYDRCRGLQADLLSAENALAEAERNSCTAPEGDSAAGGAQSGPCNFPAGMTMSDLQGQMQQCLIDNCGQTPTSMAEVQSYQSCVQKIQPAIQQQVQTVAQQLMGFASNHSPSSANQAEGSCRSLKQEVYQLQANIRQNRCDAMTEQPARPDCSAKADIELPSHVVITSAQFENTRSCAAESFHRKAAYSGILLPDAKPYADKNLDMELVFIGQALEVPHDAPFEMNALGFSNATGKVIVRIEGVAQQAHANQIRLKVKVIGQSIEPQ